MKNSNQILSNIKMPFCPGCGHTVCVRSVAKTLTNLGYSPKDVVIVSDIGCSGLVDPLFETHTIHGLHGRAPALGLGVTLGLNNSNKKVIVIQGDGGATIGLQHILEAARRNVNMTLIVLNNLLYGMTGGQMSGMSTPEFKSLKQVNDTTAPYNIVNLTAEAGASFSAKVTEISKFDTILNEAITSKGFSLVEMASLCTSHGLKKVSALKNMLGESVVYKNDNPVGISIKNNSASLFNSLQYFTPRVDSILKKPLGIIIAGSAGGGVQTAAKILAQAAILAGLNATMKGEYPITVGTGFSVAEVILSKQQIHYTGLEKPHVVLAVTNEGFKKVADKIEKNTVVYTDKSMETLYKTEPFTKLAGKKGAALSAVAYWLNETKLFPVDLLLKVINGHKNEVHLEKAINSVTLETVIA
ncbi:MAG TPA: thiamine pyrophosphate-dependent enzyme [Flavobacteriaceae bacterium]|nr:thiamine pyrophosphate-dependent enzyme [Flavobacteriaceae bacterium]